MAASADLLEKPDAPEEADEPRTLDPGRATADRVFHHSARAVATIVLALTASIGLFLGYQAVPTLHHYGLKFFTESQWQPHLNVLGLSAVLTGTVTRGREPLRARSRTGAAVQQVERSRADAAGLRSAHQAAVAYPPCRARPDLRAPYRGYGVRGSCESSAFARAYETRPAARCPTPTCMRASASHAPASSGSRRVASRAYATACTASWWSASRARRTWTTSVSACSSLSA